MTSCEGCFHTMCKYILLKMALLISQNYIITAVNEWDPATDKLHWSLYPYCGKIVKQQSANGRVVNSEDAKQHYPWVVRIDRSNLRTNKQPLETNSWCMGTVLTSR